MHDAAALWVSAEVAALDTEFSRIDTYAAVAALVQIQVDGACYLVDPLAIDDLTPLIDLCTNPATRKVLHACSEDLELFENLLGVMPEPLFDTQVAAAILGSKLSLGYQELVATVLGIEIPKGETRSDWLQRPLTPAQREYAAYDVSHLLEVYHRQIDELARSSRLAWVLEDSARLVEQQRARQDPDLYYLRVKRAWKLDRRGLMVLKMLCGWRERRAREKNRPRNWVVSDQALYALAREPVQGRRDLHEKVGMSPAQIRNVGEELLALVDDARRVPEEHCPEPLPPPPSGRSGGRLAALRRIVDEEAQQLGVVPEVLARKRQLEEFVASSRGGSAAELPPELRGWREEVIGRRLLQAIGRRAN